MKEDFFLIRSKIYFDLTNHVKSQKTVLYVRKMLATFHLFMTRNIQLIKKYLLPTIFYII